MSQAFTPRPYQDVIIDYILTNQRCGVWAGMGLGKTVSTLTALDILDLVEDAFPALVVAPLRVARSTWPDEASKWDHLQHLKVKAVTGNAVERKAALNAKAHIYTINFENLPWLVEALKDAWPFKTVVVDESTKLKGFRLRQGTLRAKALATVAHVKVDRFIELTGTPSPNGLVDLWGQAWFLDKGVRLGRTFNAFTDRWFQQLRVGSDPHAVQLQPMPHAQVEIQDRLRDICLTVDGRDYFDLREPVVNTIRVQLPPAARELYRDMEKTMFMEIEGEEIEAFGAAAKTMKCLQIANGAAYVGEDAVEWKVIHDEKIAALEEIVEEAAGMPVLVAYHFKSDLARLQRAFPKGRQLDADPGTIRDWNAGRIPLLFAHPASAGHGLNLQDGGNILAFFSVNWNLEEHQQIIERVGPTRQLQAGHDRPVFIHYILADDTVDDLILDRLQTKRQVQDILLEAMKARGLK